MKKILLIYALLIAAFLAYFFNYQYRNLSTNQLDQEGLKGGIDEKYVMVTFQSGIDYWKSCLKGFEDAAQILNVSVDYRGATQYDVHEEVTVLEQVIARKPAGIAVTAINSEALTATINKAVEAGIPVVLFDSDAPASKAYSFLATNNYSAGVTAAHKMAELIAKRGKVAIVTLPNQLNHQDRMKGFKDTIAKEYPDIQVVAVADGKGDQLVSRKAALNILQQYPDLAGIFNTDAVGGVGVGEAVTYYKKNTNVKIIGFDTDKGTLDMVKQGVISATLAQGTWNMGYWSLQFLFHLHHGLTGPTNESGSELSPLPPYVDTGTTVVTKDNVEDYYAK